MSLSHMNESMRKMNMKMNMGMHMSFFWGKDVVVLFASWPGTGGSAWMYVLALAVVFLLAVGAEILSLAPTLKPRGLGPSATAFISAVVFGGRMTLAYLVMLSVMSFNLGVFAAAVVGHSVGSFIVNYRATMAAAAAAPPTGDSSPKF